jgi:TetR/AcrR family transcriptional regulator, transcriptional repressor of bet genes
MTSTPTRAERFEERRNQLAQSALETLGELGYARTSLREIAQNSEFTHGVVHYYFADKVELIIHCVRLYKVQCVNRFDEVIAASRSAGELAERFADRLIETMKEDASLHRLWYDLRTQSLFEDAFREGILDIDRTMQDMTWRVIERYAALSGGTVLLEAQAAYALFDGLFEKALLGHLSGDPEAGPLLAERVRWLLPRICVTAASA